MFGKLIAKVVTAPIRIANIPIKATTAAFDVLCDEPVSAQNNAIDDIADVVEDSVRKVID
ncbi:MAG: hypothetical protein DRP56_04115 [Planctomycetota bacterium]|nr:MAG: hypothetical protein DRP56_04115 [Planctomycetota bacterium]